MNFFPASQRLVNANKTLAYLTVRINMQVCKHICQISVLFLMRCLSVWWGQRKIKFQHSDYQQDCNNLVLQITKHLQLSKDFYTYIQSHSSLQTGKLQCTEWMWTLLKEAPTWLNDWVANLQVLTPVRNAGGFTEPPILLKNDGANGFDSSVA